MPVRNTVEVDGAPYLVELEAISDEEHLQAYLHQRLLHDGGILLVYSINSSDSFLQAKAWAMRLAQLQPSSTGQDFSSHGGKPRPVLVLVGNKADLAAQRQVSAEAGKSLALELGVGFVETTAKYPSGIRMPISEAVARSNDYGAKSRAAMLERISKSRRGGVFSSLGKRISGVFQGFDGLGRRRKQQQQPQQDEKSGAGRGSMTPDNSAPPSVLGPRDQTRRVLKKKRPPVSARSTPQPRVRRLDVDLGAPLDTAGVYEGEARQL